MQSWPSCGGWCSPCQHSFSSGSLCTAQACNWLSQEGRVSSICLSIYLAIWEAILMVSELLSHLSNTSCVFKAFWQDFICCLTWKLHKPAGVCEDNTRLNASPHPYTNNVCLFCCPDPGCIFSPAPPDQAVPHRAAGQTSLSLQYLSRRRDGAAQLWVCLESWLWALWWVPVSASVVMEVLCPLRSPVLCFLLLCYLELQGAKQQGYENKQQLPQRQQWAGARCGKCKTNTR